jgi:uncharacterized protein YecE (DUF72 family)
VSRIRIGCSGWEYPHWRGDFYPDDLPRAAWLSYYASRFDTVEINNSFYRLPEAATFARWREAVPGAFRFAVKASRYLTHMKKLKDPAEPLDRLFSRARALGPGLGVVLYQLPPRWQCDVERLDAFLGELPAVPNAVEFREPSWYCEAVFSALARHKAALCLHDMPGSVPPRRVVGPFVYVRFHGSGPRYGGGYPASALEDWAGWLTERRHEGLPVWVYFNNDAGGHAPRDAARLREFVEKLTSDGRT